MRNRTLSRLHVMLLAPALAACAASTGAAEAPGPHKRAEATKIIAAAPEEGALDDLPALVALAEKTAPEALVTPGRRARFWASSPVMSSRFT
jgi:hypothetical protein